jgi:hypothetical protein
MPAEEISSHSCDGSAGGIHPGFAKKNRTTKERRRMIMEAVMTIDQFNTLLHSEKTENPLLTAIFKLTAVKNPEDLVKATLKEESLWAYWQ